MKTVLITIVFMSLFLGVSGSLQASNGLDLHLVVEPVVESVVEVEQLIERLAADDQSSSCQLKQEVSKSLQALTQAIRHSATAIVDVVLAAVSYVFLSIGQAFSVIELDR